MGTDSSSGNRRNSLAFSKACCKTACRWTLCWCRAIVRDSTPLSSSENSSSILATMRNCSFGGATGTSSVAKRSCVKLRPLSLMPVFMRSIFCVVECVNRKYIKYFACITFWFGRKRYIFPDIISRGGVRSTRQATPQRLRGPAHVINKSPGLTSMCGRGSRWSGIALFS